MDQLAKLGPFVALSRLWNELSPGQRLVVGAFGAVSAVAVVLIGMAASKPRMSVMFSGLASEDAGAIVQKLTDQKVPYQLSADGGTIEVPANKVYDLRLQMATQGLPQGGNVGLELFDKSNFGMTEFTERLNYQRALQGELKRTICQLAPVIDARVHIAMPEEKLYASEQEPATASVVLKLRRGTPLVDEQVGGIVHLVAAAVQGLKPSNVTVIDSDGNVLSEASAGAGGSGQLLTANQSKLKRQYETDLASNLQSMLTHIVGADKAVVRVSADMSFDQKETRSETYEPAPTARGAGQTAAQSPAGVLLSQETKSETYNGSVLPPGGVPPRAGARTASSGDNYTRTESTTQYQVTKRTEQTVSAPGQLKRLSVAVLVDEKVEPAKVGVIQQAVTAAAGIDPKRGDQVTVQRLAFDTGNEKAEADAMAKASKGEMMGSIARNAGVVVLLLVFLFALRMIVRQIRVQAPVSAPAPAPAPQARMAQAAPQQAYAAAPGAAPAETFIAAPAENALPPEVAQSKPEDLARLVRSWMSEQ